MKFVQSLFNTLPKNVEFSPLKVAPEFARALGTTDARVLDILLNPSIRLYPDVPDYILRAFSARALPVIWTQGEVGACDPWSLTYDPEKIGFQPLKIIRSGLMELLRPWKYMYDHYGQSPIVGGGNKVEPRVLTPLVEKAKLNGFDSIEGIDDRTDVLKLLEKALFQYPFQGVDLYNINRQSVRSETGLFRQTQSLHEVELRSGSLCLLDFDRTAADTDSMKEEFVLRLARL
ncbi:hypothetical protein KBD81_01810 [Candidatus Woesebacteria bacterium]|nr:hypothetical protein [Candidatus Woesebacteria bacterium]